MGYTLKRGPLRSFHSHRLRFSFSRGLKRHIVYNTHVWREGRAGLLGSRWKEKDPVICSRNTEQPLDSRLMLADGQNAVCVSHTLCMACMCLWYGMPVWMCRSVSLFLFYCRHTGFPTALSSTRFLYESLSLLSVSIVRLFAPKVKGSERKSAREERSTVRRERFSSLTSPLILPIYGLPNE